MGQNRTDTPIQLAAKRRGAENRRCRNCKRGNAMGSLIRSETGYARKCRYCGYERGYDYLIDSPFETFPRATNSQPRGDE